MKTFACHSGADLIRTDRIRRAIQRSGDLFLRRIYTANEVAQCRPGSCAYAAEQSGRDAQPLASGHLALTSATVNSLAARFAGKEAVAKALGTGIGPLQVSWTDIEILRCPQSADGLGGSPMVRLHGGARRRYEALGGFSISLSLAHEGGIALAVCTLLTRVSQ